MPLTPPIICHSILTFTAQCTPCPLGRRSRGKRSQSKRSLHQGQLGVGVDLHQELHLASNVQDDLLGNSHYLKPCLLTRVGTWPKIIMFNCSQFKKYFSNIKEVTVSQDMRSRQPSPPRLAKTLKKVSWCQEYDLAFYSEWNIFT